MSVAAMTSILSLISFPPWGVASGTAEAAGIFMRLAKVIMIPRRSATRLAPLPARRVSDGGGLADA